MNVLKKIWSFLRSMKFGVGLLLVIAALSVVGTLIQQGKPADWYAQAYPGAHRAILALQADHLYTSWYYVLLLALLGLNLTLCSVVRLGTLIRTGADEAVRAARLPVRTRLTKPQTDAVRMHLRAKRCTEREIEGATVFSKFHFGRYGTFLTHLGILLTLLFGAAALYLPKVSDMDCLPGDSITVEGGAKVYVQDFRIEDDAGKLDYASDLYITLPSGDTSDLTHVSVNHPLTYGSYKIFQQYYGTAAAVTVTDHESGEEETFTLTDASMLSKDGKTGLWVAGVYDLAEDENGAPMLVSNQLGSYQNPIYEIQTVEQENSAALHLPPGGRVTVGDLEFRMDPPVEYPGLRIKYTPRIVNILLVAAFAVLTIGLYITFFMQPVLVKLTDEGYTVAGTKPEGMRVELEQLLEEEASKSQREEKKTK